MTACCDDYFLSSFILPTRNFQQSINLCMIYSLFYAMNRTRNSKDPVPFYTFVQLDTILGCLRICVPSGQEKGVEQLGLYSVQMQLH